MLFRSYACTNVVCNRREADHLAVLLHGGERHGHMHESAILAAAYSIELHRLSGTGPLDVCSPLVPAVVRHQQVRRLPDHLGSREPEGVFVDEPCRNTVEVQRRASEHVERCDQALRNLKGIVFG